MDELERAQGAFARALVDALPADGGTVAGARREALRRAFARVPREAYLGPPPWPVWRPGTSGSQPTDDPRELQADVLVDVDSRRRINNGLPSLWAGVYDTLGIREGERVVHVGCGTGYYSAILAELVGPTGRVLAVELEPDLAARARRNLGGAARVEVVCGDGTAYPKEPCDVVVVNAGGTRIAEAWLDGLAPGGRLYVPLTVNPDDPERGIGVGVGWVVERRGDAALAARLAGTVGIYPCIGGRSAEADRALHAALSGGLEAAGAVRSLRRDAHPEEPGCWVHLPGCCLSRDEPAG